MARGVQLSQLVTDLQSEIGHSTQAALGRNLRPALINTLQRVQRQLHDDYDWPFLRVREVKQLQAGQKLYDLPTNVQLERVERIEYKTGGKWRKLDVGVGMDEYNQYDSDVDERASQAMRWEPQVDGQYEIWPLVDENGVLSTLENYVRVVGIRELSNFIADSDTADLDDTLLVLFAATEYLTRQKSPDAEAKSILAQSHYTRIKGRLAKKKTFTMGGGEVAVERERLTARRL